MKALKKMWGPQGNQLGDEPGQMTDNNRALQHFDHNFKGSIHTIKGGTLEESFGACEFAENRNVYISVSAASMEISEEQGLRATHTGKIMFKDIIVITWDHSVSAVKFELASSDEDVSFIAILNLDSSVDFEAEMKLRLSSLNGTRIPQFAYVGMFAGATKPKPFQRKRPNLSKLPSGKLPPLGDMRSMATELHRGDYQPTPNGQSRRIALAVQHIYEGYNSFNVLQVKGNINDRMGGQALLLFYDDKISFRSDGFAGSATDFAYTDIEDWGISEDKVGVEIYLKSRENIYFHVEYVRDVQHTFEYFWNKHCVENRMPVKLGSTHGRPLETIHTLSGERPAAEPPIGSTEIVDSEGMPVRPGGKLQRRKSLIQQLGGGENTPAVVPPEKSAVRAYWSRVVKHQGWLQKKGGVGIGAAKNWIKRYFVLYGTSQGHFLCYYSDFTECPLYTSERNHRNVVDICKACFIRPGSIKSAHDDYDDAPTTFSFDIVTTEREWTLCADSKESMQKWLKLLTRAVDEDVAILPDEELVFNVKPKVDPTHTLPADNYATQLRCSAFGVRVSTPESGQEEYFQQSKNPPRDHFFWIYTDFYKWSLLTQNGKLALLINVFADEAFSRKNEFVFRHKEAVRLATAIEYFIEKFMSVMHLKLEILGLPDEPDVPQNGTTENRNQNTNSSSAPVVDLLDMSTPEPPAPVTTAPPVPPQRTTNDDPFSNDPFGGSSNLSNLSIGASPAVVNLTPQQNTQHTNWFKSAIMQGGPMYDDGCVQIAVQTEMKGSQGRMTFYQRNISSNAISEFSLQINDSVGMLRTQLNPSNPSLPPGGQAEQQMMFECVKPVAPGPTLTVSYVAPDGRRSNNIHLPVVLTSFNAPMALSGVDWNQRWNSLNNPDQQVIDTFDTSISDVNALKNLVGNVMKFGLVESVAGGDLLNDMTSLNNGNTVMGCSQLRTGALNQSGEKINVGSLVKAELNPMNKKVHLTIRTIYPAASQALMVTAKQLMGINRQDIL